MLFQETPLGPEERTYHGSIPDTGYRKVIVQEQGLSDYELPSMDGSQDFNWGYGGGGPKRLADALASNAFEDTKYGEAFGWELDRRVVQSLPMQKPFVLSRDRILLEGLLAFNDWVRKRDAVGGQYYMSVIEELLARKSETRDRIMQLFSENSSKHLLGSSYGLKK